MLEISSKTNLLEKKSYKYSLQDVAEPNLHREVYSYGTIPKVAFNHRRVPMAMPEEIWITDTSLRDGQQSVEPYSVDQIVNIYKLLNKLGGPYGIIRQTDFGAEVELELLFPEAEAQNFLDKLTDMTSGTVEGMETAQEYRAFPVDT